MNKTVIKILSLILFVSAFLPFELSSIICSISIFTIIVLKPIILQKVFNKFLIIMILICLVVYPVLSIEKDSAIWIINYSNSSLINGLKIITRAILILLAFNLISIASKDYNIKSFWQKIGLNSFDKIFDISKDLLPSAFDVIKNKFTRNKRQNLKNAFFHPIHFISDILARFIMNSTKNHQNYEQITMRDE